MFILRLHQALVESGVDYAIVGGHAVNLHGAVRGTLDVDIVIAQSQDQYVRAERALSALGMRGRLPVDAASLFDSRQDCIENRNLIAWSFYHPENPAELVDILVTYDVNALGRLTIDLQGQSLNVVSMDDLIEMKRKAGRQQDLADVAALERLR